MKSEVGFDETGKGNEEFDRKEKELVGSVVPVPAADDPWMNASVAADADQLEILLESLALALGSKRADGDICAHQVPMRWCRQ
ncbi:hypothetical protein ACLOJK_000407 [Asimina triloba]